MQDDNGRRFYFAWAHDRAENSDRGEWYWGGTFCIPHEVVATSDGQLDVKLPEEYVNCFKEKVDGNTFRSWENTSCMEIQRLSWMDAGQPRMVSWS